MLFVRLFRSFDAIVGSNETLAREWLSNENTTLSSMPLENIVTIVEFVDVIDYLDVGRALI